MFDGEQCAKHFTNKYYGEGNGFLNKISDYRTRLFHLTNTARAGHNLVVNMQKHIIPNDPSIETGKTQIEESSSLSKGKKRVL
jgi:hypothetical protein